MSWSLCRSRGQPVWLNHYLVVLVERIITYHLDFSFTERMCLYLNRWKNFGERVHSLASKMSNGLTLVWEVVYLEPIQGTDQLELTIRPSEWRIIALFNLQYISKTPFLISIKFFTGDHGLKERHRLPPKHRSLQLTWMLLVSGKSLPYLRLSLRAWPTELRRSVWKNLKRDHGLVVVNATLTVIVS